MVNELNKIMEQAHDAFMSYQNVSGDVKKTFLYTIASELEANSEAIIQSAMHETHLPQGRFAGELGRTCMQLRMFGDIVGEGSWVEAVIDTALLDRKPLPKPDMRKMNIPMGPIVVFGASNFPLAYSTPGGDTASALASGCSVVVKGHPAHPKTSLLCTNAIQSAVIKCHLHPHTFQHVSGDSFEIGRILTQHRYTAGVGFTGSLVGGRAIFDYAQQREVPIPVFSEMGSTNPVLLLKDALNTKSPEMAKAFAASITMGVGQFCTNPGIMLGVKSSGLNNFTNILAIELSQVTSHSMLHDGIYSSYKHNMEKALLQQGVEMIYHSQTEEPSKASIVLARVSGQDFIKNPELHHEVFGPYSLIVVCSDMAELIEIWSSLKGQLTTTFMATESDLHTHGHLIHIAKNIAGRVIYNGTPTGVEVGYATVHGGPYPATTDGRFTSVGADSIKRWVRPVCFQDCPDVLLPDELKNANPVGIWRKVDTSFQRDPL